MMWRVVFALLLSASVASAAVPSGYPASFNFHLANFHGQEVPVPMVYSDAMSQYLDVPGWYGIAQGGTDDSSLNVIIFDANSDGNWQVTIGYQADGGTSFDNWFGVASLTGGGVFNFLMTSHDYAAVFPNDLPGFDEYDSFSGSVDGGGNMGVQWSVPDPAGGSWGALPPDMLAEGGTAFVGWLGSGVMSYFDLGYTLPFFGLTLLACTVIYMVVVRFVRRVGGARASASSSSSFPQWSQSGSGKKSARKFARREKMGVASHQMSYYGSYRQRHKKSPRGGASGIPF